MRLPVVATLGSLGLLISVVACSALNKGAGRTPGVLKAEGQSSAPGDPAHNLLGNRDFASTSMLPWIAVFSPPADGEATIKNGALCVRVKAGGQAPSDAQVRHRALSLQQNHEYTVSFKAWATRDFDISARVGMAAPPNTDYWKGNLPLKSGPRTFAYRFKMSAPDDGGAELTLQFGGELFKDSEPVEICFDETILSDPEYKPAPLPKAVAVPRLRVNQLGYLPNLPKRATLISDAKLPLEFQLLTSNGKVVQNGRTSVRGPDAASGDNLHEIDFSSYTTAGKGYVLKARQDSSEPFDIERSIYKSAKYHAFRYFYLNRSGIEISLPYARKSAWTRPPGHPKDEAPCSADAKCGYSLDVTGGWYDGGDYGKYVVSGAVAAWTLLNWFERTKAVGGDASAFADLKEVVPESGNKIPDILDEVRWELEFLLRMQVPVGNPQAGMVHHKVHDVSWTPLGLGPHESQVKRELRPVSTAATLDLAAVAAQAARIYKPFDGEFAARCLTAAEAAWAAAKANPSALASATDANGGGAYADDDVSDEFYWAASELWVTTGNAEYKVELEGAAQDHGLEVDKLGYPALITWQRVDALAKISMALALPLKKAKTEREKYRQQIGAAAERLAKIAQNEGYRIPFNFGTANGYPLGSNGIIANNALVLAIANDFAKQASYRDAIVSALDYLFGRNAMALSYVTGLGKRAATNLHHRFWANQANDKYPAPAPGALVGGPDSRLEDPYTAAAGLKGCKPQKCYVDHSEAWSVNEATIDTNAALLWVLAWADEQVE